MIEAFHIYVYFYSVNTSTTKVWIDEESHTSMAVKIDDNLMFLSGQPGSGLNMNESVFEATDMVNDVLGLAEADASDIVMSTAYLSDYEEYSEFNSMWAEFFGDHKPPRTSLAVGHPQADSNLNLEFIAAPNSEIELVGSEGRPYSSASIVNNELVFLSGAVAYEEEDRVDFETEVKTAMEALKERLE